ncbi:MAG: DUF5655 domain-containing protein [Saprospiraceae bacterium]
MEDSIEDKTGKELDEWFKILEKTDLDKHRAILNHLKVEYDISYGYANLIALKFLKSDAASNDDGGLVQTQYKGKEELLPVYKSLDAFIRQLGTDVKVVPKKAAVSYIRTHQFALVKPATKTRIDLGIKIKGQKPEGILEESGPFGAMCTHRIQINAGSELNQEIKKWIELAYKTSV